MFEYHGWMCIVVAPYDVEDEDEKLHQIVNYIRELIDRTLPKHHIAHLKPINGEYMACFAGFMNHSTPGAEAVINIFREVAQKAPGSYGLLYIWDESVRELNNEFQVGKLARGKFEILEDRYLSPRIPTIEDEW